MANVDNATGLSFVKHQLGAPLNAVVNPYYVPSSGSNAIFIGDPVTKTGTANTGVVALGSGDWLAGMLPAIDVHTAGAGSGSVCTGVVVGKRNNLSNMQQLHNPASTEAVMMVCDDPHTIFRIKEDSVGGALAVVDIGLNADIALDVAGSTTSGLSGAELDSSTKNSSASRTLKILRLSDRTEPNGVRNAIGADARWEVLINQHTESHNSAGV